MKFLVTSGLIKSDWKNKRARQYTSEFKKRSSFMVNWIRSAIYLQISAVRYMHWRTGVYARYAPEFVYNMAIYKQ